jgi:predicted acyl esterase
MPTDTSSPTAVYHALKLDKDVHIPMRDSAYVVADVFRPDTDGRFPIIINRPKPSA